jgi:uncharacterized secreted repeat protein (TIGR03808 family)
MQMQEAIDQTAIAGGTLELAPGRYVSANLVLRPGTRIIGTPGATILVCTQGHQTLMQGETADGLVLSGLVLDGASPPSSTIAPPTVGVQGILDIARSSNVRLTELAVRNSPGNAVSLTKISGWLTDSSITNAGRAGILSTDATGLQIANNLVSDCADNGILVWRTTAGEDGTLVSANRIERIGARSGGSGQFGNGINVFRAANVLVSGNRISDCAYTAVRGNAASNIQIVANNTSRLGEVALYAEFGFEGALIANNLVDGAAAGISVTNFNEGGRLAVVQGNLIRNLARREHEPVDKRGEGICVEADAIVSSNVIENAPTAGIVIGWGNYMREVVAAANVIRRARIGIMITSEAPTGACLVRDNLISGTTDGAVRSMLRGQAIGPDLVEPMTAGRLVRVDGNVSVSPAS